MEPRQLPLLWSGVAALILSIDPSLTQQQVRDIIETTTQKVRGYYGGGVSYNIQKTNGTWNNQTGYGLIDANAAVLKALDQKTIFNIIGDTYVCSKNYYRVDYLPANSTVKWEMINNSGNAPYPALVNGTTRNECAIDNKYKYPIQFILKATITRQNGKQYIATKTIIAEASPTIPTGKFTQTKANIINANIPSGAAFIKPNYEAIFQFSNLSNKNVSLGTMSGNGTPTYWSYDKASQTLWVMLPAQGGSGYTFTIGNEGSCGAFNFTLFASETAISPGSAVRSALASDIQEGSITVYEILTGRKVYETKEIQETTFKINQIGLKEGLYIIVYETKEDTKTEKVYLKY